VTTRSPTREQELRDDAEHLDDLGDGLAVAERTDTIATMTAVAVLADYYEDNGQPSRAALWREHARLVKLGAHRRFPPDLLLKKNSLSSVDPRRNAMIWLLHCVWRDDGGMHALRKMNWLPIHFSLTWSTIRAIVKKNDRAIFVAAITECKDPTMRATQRLIEARALPALSSGDYFLSSVEIPPDTWPVTNNDVRRRGKAPADNFIPDPFPASIDQILQQMAQQPR
jgi:hypothetical protein